MSEAEIFTVDVPVIGKVLYDHTPWQAWQAAREGLIKTIRVGKTRMKAPIYPNCMAVAGGDDKALAELVAAVRRAAVAEHERKKAAA